ncbi:MAG: response regulator [Anaerolineae bacterium]|jgi:pilus assembly protein CpaE|nr:response regulator [Anaerolineae bacterium]MDH7475044.1 response regulator [Anaerolineae bacterium]
MEKSRILVVDDSKFSAKMIESRLVEAGFQVDVAYSAEQAIASLSAPGSPLPDLVISDVVMPGMDGYQFCRWLRGNPATVRVPVIMLTSKGGVSAKVDGFQAGADDYLVKPVDPTELEMRIKVLLARVKALKSTAGGTAAMPTQARVISVFSLRGGVGVTSVAVNLAVALAQMWQADVPLLDLSLQSGHCALLLDLRPQHSLADLAERGPDEIDSALLEGVFVRHNSGVRVLAAPPAPELADTITTTLVDSVLTTLRPQFSYLVIDTPSRFDEVTLTALDRSDVIVLLLSPEIASLKVTTAALNVFQALEYPPQKTVAVLNWPFARGGLPQKNIEAALHMPLTAVIPHEPALFVEAINQGVPLVLRRPDAPASLALQQLAYRLSGEQPPMQKTRSPSEMLLRVQELVKRA